MLVLSRKRGEQLVIRLGEEIVFLRVLRCLAIECESASKRRARWPCIARRSPGESQMATRIRGVGRQHRAAIVTFVAGPRARFAIQTVLFHLSGLSFGKEIRQGRQAAHPAHFSEVGDANFPL